jgi:hypothetical protein
MSLGRKCAGAEQWVESGSNAQEVRVLPGYDGTGPRGEGPMTGRGEGHCVLQLDEAGRVTGGFAGIEGWPVVPRQAVKWALWALARGRRKKTADRDHNDEI